MSPMFLPQSSAKGYGPLFCTASTTRRLAGADTLSCPVDSVPLLHPLQLEHSGVWRRATDSSSMHPTDIHSSDLCSAGASLQHDIWQRHNVPLQSTQSVLPSSPSFGFQEPLCSLKCFVNAASFTSAGEAKTPKTTQNPL